MFVFQNNRYPLHYAYALPDEVGMKYVRLILAKEPHLVENLRDKVNLYFIVHAVLLKFVLIC